MHSTIGLREYLMSNPDLAAHPTLSQSGALALVLARQQNKAASRLRQRARRQARRASWRTFLRALWHAVTGLPSGIFRLRPAMTPPAARLEQIILPTR